MSIEAIHELQRITSMNNVSIKMRKRILLSGFSFRSTHNLTPKPNHLSFEGFNSGGSSNMQWCGLSCAAAAADVPSETSNSPKSRKRLPKHERRAMVESFVNKYRSENAGKFPNIKYTCKQVGGGYYIIREIIQELQYKSKMETSNHTDKILVEKLPDMSKHKTAKPVEASSGNIETAKNRLIQDDYQLVILGDNKTVNTVCEHLEENRGPQTSSLEGRLSNEDEIISSPDNRCITSEKEPYLSSLQKINDIKTVEDVSSYSDSIAPKSQLLQKEIEPFPTPFSESYDAVYGKTRGDESEVVDMENHQKMEEKCIKNVGHERSEQHALEDMSGKASHSCPEVPNDVKSVEAVSSNTSDYVLPERDLQNEKIEQVSAPIIEKSGSSCSKDQRHYKLVDIEINPTNEIKGFEKAGTEIKVQDGLQDLPGLDNPKHKRKQSEGSLELDESKINSSNKRETSIEVVSDKSTLWGNLKSFADGIINMWRKL